MHFGVLASITTLIRPNTHNVITNPITNEEKVLFFITSTILSKIHSLSLPGFIFVFIHRFSHISCPINLPCVYCRGQELLFSPCCRVAKNVEITGIFSQTAGLQESAARNPQPCLLGIKKGTNLQDIIILKSVPYCIFR